jgi:4-amino-4-deoxy-L-arabinose transferase-like glycosyltransferase
MDNKKIKGIVPVIVIAISVLTAFWGLTSRAVGNHEALVGVTARNMFVSGNWVLPVFNGEPRLNKTPLSYWLVAAAGKAAGGVNDFALRLPSAALAVLSAMAIFYFVTNQLGFRTGALSALVWATTLCFFRYSHTGRPEMALTCFVTIAMLSFYSAITAKSRSKQIYCMLVFWVSFSLAMLAKGPAPLLLIFPALFFYFAILGKWKLIGKLLPVTGVILFLVIFLPWPITVLIKHPEAVEIWKNEFLGRAAGEYASGSEPFYFYFWVMFALFIPYCAFIPLALAMPFYKIWEEKRDAIFYLFLWFAVGLAAMTLCGGKRQHYILPIMPAMAAMTGIILDDMIFVHKAYAENFSRNFLLAYLFILAGLCVIIFVRPNILSKDEDDGNYAIRDFAQEATSAAEAKEVVGYFKVDASFIYYLNRNVPVSSDIDKIYSEYPAGCWIAASDKNFEELKKDKRFSIVWTGIDKKRGFFEKNQAKE